ncbi:thymidine phosphorylase [Mycoplasma sp. T363T]|uniref:thymidine phosphorylase n=1 Tax=Mycoplasma bradburyae TaxID=2963128 RepID=UPI00234259EA|nr:thymidine phosphorylase [Mycoplasma bradburyae]MDC4163567.1 thymidine phosphorylase [Mycoplasma bradburyae]
MNIVEIIDKKKNKKVLTKEEIGFFINKTVDKTIPDYQISALLMAIWFNGLNEDELYYLTDFMMKSGKTLSFDTKDKKSIDKHSTGGVGDKVSIALAPVLASFGFKISKMSGRGLAHTGGTIDKLESIGVDCSISIDEAKKILDENDMFIISQTDDLVLADKILYAIRDVTSTTDCLDLIASSIISKKFAINSDYIFIDIKYGAGAFCQTIEQANELKRRMLVLAKRFNRHLVCELNDMNEVLGNSIGNAIEIKEAVAYLKNELDNKNSFKILMDNLLSEILVETKKFDNKNQALQALNELLNTTKPFDKFIAWIKSQKGDWLAVSEDRYFNPKYQYEIKAKQEAKIVYTSPVDLALVSLELGAGRKLKNQPIDFQAGIYLHKKSNDHLKKDETIMTLYSSKPIDQVIIDKALSTIKYET